MLPTIPVNLFKRPFANNGTFQVIPDIKNTEGRASLAEGFPVETQLPLSAGGIAPNRMDFNGILYMLSAFAFWSQSGGQWVYRPDLDYNVPCIVYYDDNLWWCAQPNGPTQVSGSVTPGTNKNYWISLLDFLAGVGSEGDASTVLGNPVGAIIMFHGVTAPDGYLPCDGSTFSASSYPKLYALLGKSVTPDMRGLFVRGLDPQGLRDPDGTTRDLGSLQTDMGRAATGYASRVIDNRGGAGSGVFYNAGSTGNASGSGDGYALGFDISRAWGAAHTGPEFRSVNINLLYCIRHD
jgi:hypothetical protein